MENNTKKNNTKKNNTKKNYATPEAEKIMFNYRDQVVAASQGCHGVWSHIGLFSCNDTHVEYLN